MRDLPSIVSLTALVALLATGSVTRGQQLTGEATATCQASGPVPGGSGAWAVTFCNRTGHDLVVEFRDNDCPADGWRRRGDVYRRTIQRGTNLVVSLCYAVEPQSVSPPIGVPMVRIPGGKGVVTSWSVIGDCGDGSDQLHQDARSFYDRGAFETGIVLLQYPAGPPHCIAGHSRGDTSAASAAQSHTADRPPSAGALPFLSVIVDPSDKLGRTVRVLSQDNFPGRYRCSFKVSLTFSDGGTWLDSGRADLPGGEGGQVVATRKYLKSVSKAVLTAGTCIPR